MTNTFEIAEHPFFVAVIKNVQPLIKASLDKAPTEEKAFAEWRRANRARMTVAQRYAVDVFHRATNLSHVFDRLSRARYLLSRSPASYRTKKVSLNRNEWTEYHFFVYTTSLASILDCTLLLTAEVYNLGLLPRFCTFEIVTQHQWIAGTNVAKALRHLKKTLEEHTQRRHRYLHRGEESNLGELTSPDVFWRLHSVTFLADKVDLDIPHRTISLLWKLQLREIGPKLQSFETNIYRNLSDALASLQPAYDRYLSAYRSSSNTSTE